MNDFKFECPHCKQSLEADEDLFGESIPCPACNEQLRVPFPKSHDTITVTEPTDNKMNRAIKPKYPHWMWYAIGISLPLFIAILFYVLMPSDTEHTKTSAAVESLTEEALAKPPVHAVGTEPDPPKSTEYGCFPIGGTTSVSSAGGFARASENSESHLHALNHAAAVRIAEMYVAPPTITGGIKMASLVKYERDAFGDFAQRFLTQLPPLERRLFVFNMPFRIAVGRYRDRNLDLCKETSAAQFADFLSTIDDDMRNRVAALCGFDINRLTRDQEGTMFYVFVFSAGQFINPSGPLYTNAYRRALANIESDTIDDIVSFLDTSSGVTVRPDALTLLLKASGMCLSTEGEFLPRRYAKILEEIDADAIQRLCLVNSELSKHMAILILFYTANTGIE